MVDVLLNEHWSDGFNSLKKANIKHWSDGLNSLKMANIKKKAWKHVYSKSDIGYCIIKRKPASQGALDKGWTRSMVQIGTSLL